MSDADAEVETEDAPEPEAPPADDVPGTEPEAISAAAVTASRSGGRATVLRAVAAVVLVAAVASAITFFVLWRRADAANRTRKQVASVATAFLGALTNFRASTISTDVQRIRGYAVGDFADQVTTFFGPGAVDAIRRSDARSVGRVQSVFVETIQGAQASVFGLVNETVTNSSSPTPRAELVRIELQMIHTSAGWKVSQANIFQSPGATIGPGS